MSVPAHLELGLYMFSARSSEVLLALLVLPHFQPLLPVRGCLLLVSRHANTWTTKSPMGTTHLLGALVFCWLPPHIKPDRISHLVCSNESAILSTVGLLLQQTGTGSLCSWKLTGHTHTHNGRKSCITTQSTSDKCFSKGTGMGHVCASASTHSPSEQSQVAFWGTPRKAEFLRLPNKFLQILSDTLFRCFSHYLSPQ